MRNEPMNKLLSLLIIATGLFFSSQESIAFSFSFFKDHARGWHWYDDPESKEEDPIEQDPVVEMNQIKSNVERARDKMVLQPTKENVKSYIILQNQISKNAHELSKTWREVLIENPNLDFSLQHPTSNVAKQVEYAILSKKEKAAIRELASKNGLFFFYRSSCPYCVRFSPIVKDFAESNNIPLIAITTDGISLPEFPHSLPDQGQAAKFQVKVEPALFIVNPYTHQAIPVSYGLTSEADLKSRILQIVESRWGNRK